MGTTSNYSWPYPESTGLVKDGWEDIKDLATAIDTTAAASFSGGLSLISTTSLSAVASQSFNDVFSATYDHYKIYFSFTPTNTTFLRFRLRDAGADLTTSHYSNAFYAVANAGALIATAQNTNETSALPTGIIASGRHQYIIDIFEPFASETTGASMRGNRNDGSGNMKSLFGGFQYNQNTSADGCTLYVDAGTITGSVTIFGVKK